MLLFPAIDLYDHKVVRLLKGDYQKMTVYSEDPVATARDIEADGGRWLHLVDLEGAKDGTTPNFDVVAAICHETKLQVEIGGGIRSLEMIERYLNAGVARVILGTKAVTDEDFLRDAVRRWGDRIAVGVDAKDGRVAVKGWVEVLDVDMFDFLWKLRSIGVKTAIVTDISKGAPRHGALRRDPRKGDVQRCHQAEGCTGGCPRMKSRMIVLRGRAGCDESKQMRMKCRAVVKLRQATAGDR